MDMFEAFQDYFFKKTVKINGGDNSAETGRLHRSSSRSYSCGCGSAARKRDGSTSAHDLSTYVWCTDGDEVGISTSIRTDEDNCSNCRKGSNRKHSPSKGCKTELQGNVCDASTSTFDLSTFVWGTAGDTYTTDLSFDEDMDDNGFAPNLGDMDNARRTSGGVDRKRSRAAAALGFIIPAKNGELPAPPRKKKRRIGN